VQSGSAACSPSSPDLEERLGHRFSDRDLLRRALTHSSANAKVSNERLEFLGDRVLGLVIAENLHVQFPDDAEGVMALKLNALVRQETCARIADAVGLGEQLILAQSEIKSGGRRKSAILAGTTEAVIAALYLDGGLETARRFIDCYWEGETAALGRDMRDAKTTLQEWAQSRGRGAAAPVYEQVRREGPDHAPRFWVQVNVNGVEPQIGEGASKREAEQDAARLMLAKVTP
jgi:ribonuclease III